MQKHPKYQPVLASLGEAWEFSSQIFEELEEFTCAIDGYPQMKCVNDLRYYLMQAKCVKEDGSIDAKLKFDMASLPPCKHSLEQHIRRVNYKVNIWKSSMTADQEVPCATNGHGWTLVNNIIEPLCYGV